MSKVLKKYKNVFFIGIGGISMSGLAEILRSWNVMVSGSNNEESKVTKYLSSLGMDVKIGHNANNITNQDLVVYTAAIPSNNPELLKARELNIKTLERADFVGELTTIFKDSICISGTHGKSTTSSMITSCFVKDNLDPTVQIGANLDLIKGNYRIGKSEYFILEACEYVDSFLKFFPKSEVILNIDNDHLNYFESLENIKISFKNYVNLLPKDGLLIINDDDINCRDIYSECKGRVLTYSIKNDTANYYAKNIKINDLGYPSFDVYHNNLFYNTFSLSVLGLHNVSNALACIALCCEYNLKKESIKDALESFKGIDRRFEFLGTYNNILVYDDYAHHPTEIKTTLDSVKSIKHNKSWAVFQPHTYSRTKDHYQEFGKVLANFDNIIITEIYAAREEKIYNISENDIVEIIKKKNSNVINIGKYSDIVNYLKENAKAGDLIIIIGAGPINEVGLELLNRKENN